MAKSATFGWVGVRLATTADAAVVGRLLDEFATEFDEPTAGPDELGRRAEALMAAGEAEFVIGSVGDEPAAGLVQLRYRRSVWSGALDAYLEDLFVRGPARRRGLGAALLSFAQDRARERGAAYMEIAVYEGDREAMSLYLTRGFRHWEEEDEQIPLDERPRYLYFVKPLTS